MRISVRAGLAAAAAQRAVPLRPWPTHSALSTPPEHLRTGDRAGINERSVRRTSRGQPRCPRHLRSPLWGRAARIVKGDMLHTSRGQRAH
ncbi:hypothetical protein AURDEDRAFT_176815 [Auricularia subglabra TFB-10046 SS5]|uniref:Uncharacterized protein n=1 Tax=Auricularia subglabra (strain TFB-10046 / SS5) TaxID=717982 RepID=J0CUU7_AURST|nr:hypothetical protein AURDEDRAFT_176815 [Auricularia subglabra TFB-10046 SS5]